MSYYGLLENPSKCPECSRELTNKNWRVHLRLTHGWYYAVTRPKHIYRNALFPPAEIVSKGTGIRYAPPDEEKEKDD